MLRFAGGSRSMRRCASVCATAVVQLRRAAGNDIDFVFRGPDIVALAGYADELARARRNSAASSTRTQR